MEEMIPELEDLEKKGYFSNSEIKQVVQKRQDFEYLLKRRTALKTDYYRQVKTRDRLKPPYLFLHTGVMNAYNIRNLCSML